MRFGNSDRKTKETDVSIKLSLDGGDIDISTGIGFFDHMLCALATHAGFGLIARAKGDLNVDCHHTVEDMGIVLGQALVAALADKRGINRFANIAVPMDEALATCALDISGRPFLKFDAVMPQERIGEYDACMTIEFFRAIVNSAGLTLHISAYGENSHHITEAIFKAFARAIKCAVEITGEKLPSTKGAL
ncbi:MAG: imidazoleglycerol-phosphate dehydratase HisB [Clostridia bacterium]